MGPIVLGWSCKNESLDKTMPCMTSVKFFSLAMVLYKGISDLTWLVNLHGGLVE